jgi:hypothetical protein
MQLGEDSSHHSSSRDDLAKLITKHLEVSNSDRPTTSDLKLKHSVKEVRIAGENNHIFIRGKNF